MRGKKIRERERESKPAEISHGSTTVTLFDTGRLVNKKISHSAQSSHKAGFWLLSDGLDSYLSSCFDSSELDESWIVTNGLLKRWEHVCRLSSDGVDLLIMR